MGWYCLDGFFLCLHVFKTGVAARLRCQAAWFYHHWSRILWVRVVSRTHWAITCLFSAGMVDLMRSENIGKECLVAAGIKTIYRRTLPARGEAPADTLVV